MLPIPKAPHRNGHVVGLFSWECRHLLLETTITLDEIFSWEHKARRTGYEASISSPCSTSKTV
jgi:hypothetical protein